MGGFGSGGMCRWNKKTTLEETKCIDIRYMNKRKLLTPGVTGSLRWTVRGAPNGDIRFYCHDGYLQLDFRYRENGGEWQSMMQRISFDSTSCNYGGVRLWFLCPHCEKRVAVLSAYGVRFLCRHCYQLTHASKQESRMTRMISQKHKLGARIFEHYDSGEGFGKKKGMHWKTFERLHVKYQQLDYAINYLIAKRINLV